MDSNELPRRNEPDEWVEIDGDIREIWRRWHRPDVVKAVAGCNETDRGESGGIAEVVTNTRGDRCG